jgi:lipid-A-disaccharide synthase
MTRVLVSAGDASGDALAAGLVRALRKRVPDAEFEGLGGSALRAAGMTLCADQRDLAVGGLLELGSSGLRLNRAWRHMGRALTSARPDLVVLVDSGGFNLPFARRIRRTWPGAPILYYVAPQVWAWRTGRIRKIASRVDRVAVIFPFEADAYAGSGVAVDFVGHPLVDELGQLCVTLDRGAARSLLKLDAHAPMVALLPGSRRNEIAHQLPLQLAAAKALLRRAPGTSFALALAPSIQAEQVEAGIRRAALPSGLRLDVVHGRTRELMRAADVVLAKPGTVTVEAMLLERPMLVMGHANALTAAILRRTVRVAWLAMPNLIAGERIVPELLQEHAQPEAMAAALAELLNGPARALQLERLAEAASKLGPGGAAENAARIAEEMIARGGR